MHQASCKRSGLHYAVSCTSSIRSTKGRKRRKEGEINEKQRVKPCIVGALSDVVLILAIGQGRSVVRTCPVFRFDDITHNVVALFGIHPYRQVEMATEKQINGQKKEREREREREGHEGRVTNKQRERWMEKIKEGVK